ncbi:MAG TPA: ATP-binding protein [Verrucomicrobiae bacterium]|nr:ATP-binding protein [Verrucomicrobiae bacterium]
MGHFRFLLNTSLRTKVLVPVIACMVTLIAITVFVVDQRVRQQFEQQAGEALTAANAEFLNLQNTRSQDLLLRFHNLPNEPRYRAAFQLGDPATLRQPLADLLREQGSDIVFYTSVAKRILASEQLDPAISASDFQAAAAPAVQNALAGKAAVDTVLAAGHLYHVVSIPVNVAGEPIGALTLGLQIGDTEAQQFSQLTHSQIALLAGGRVVASTLSGAGADAEIGNIYGTLRSDNTSVPSQVKQVLWGGEHYFRMAGTFKSLTGDKTLGYVLLSSYEKPLSALHQTQQLLLIASLCAIFIGGAIVWWVIRKTTQPLLDLRESVEAVGRGDLSRRVAIKYQDECGELAEVYNRMADNLKESRDQLEKAHGELVESSRLAGMAEIASGVMHNVNNVLTSINIASTLVAESIKHSKAANLGKVVSLLREHEADLGQFLTQDPKGRQAYSYLGALSEHLVKEQEGLLRELAQIQQGTRHIEEIVHAQQNFAKLSGLVETLKVTDMIGDALKMSVAGRNGLQVVKEIPEDMTVTVEKHKALQILVNLMRNAKQACEAGPAEVKTLTIRATNGGDFVHLAVSDNGVGIDPDNMRRIFSHGFTTKKDGHGFGLHSSAAAAKQLGGLLRVNSEGLGKGATFTLDLPVKPTPAQQN